MTPATAARHNSSRSNPTALEATAGVCPGRAEFGLRIREAARGAIIDMNLPHHNRRQPVGFVPRYGPGAAYQLIADHPPRPFDHDAVTQEGAAIRSIQVVDVQELKADVRSQVDALVARTKQEQMNSLRKTIDATPEALSAIKAKGRSSAQFVTSTLTRTE